MNNNSNMVILKQVELDDLPYYKKLFLNPLVMSMIYSKSPVNDDSIKNIIHAYIERWANNDLLSPFTITNKNNEFIGYVNLNHASCKQPGHVEIGLMLLPQYWNQGFAFYAAQAIGTYLQILAHDKYQVKDKCLHGIIATSHPNNIVPIKFLNRFNFKEIGCAYRGDHNTPRTFFYRSLIDENQQIPFKPYDLLHDVVS